jgi:hypothetical protein
MDTDLSLKIENVMGGLRGYGYLVTAKPVEGQEAEYYMHFRDALLLVEGTVYYLHKNARCRGKSKRTLSLLHKALPEPCWGVAAPTKEAVRQTY